MSILDALRDIQAQIPSQTKIVAVSKTHPAELIEEAYASGQRLFGENKAQELKEKYALLPKDIEWHFIGHLQSNKIKYIAPFVSLIHGIDSLKLLTEVNKEAAKVNRVIDCLLQFHIAKEDTKFGLSMEEATELLNSKIYSSLQNIRITGVMGMATFTDNTHLIHEEFHSLKQHFIKLKKQFFSDMPTFKEISMGMSADYLIAVEEGSTLIRVGGHIFGERDYTN